MRHVPTDRPGASLFRIVAIALRAGRDDDYHAGAPGDVWKVELTNLGTGNLTDLRFASAGLDAYQEAAWIFIQTYGTPSSQWPDMNFAVWHIFNPTVQITPQAQHWIDLAILFHSRLDCRGVFIATPVDINAPPTGDQKFFLAPSGATTFGSPVPEPGSLGFLGTGALAVISTPRRSWKN